MITKISLSNFHPCGDANPAPLGAQPWDGTMIQQSDGNFYADTSSGSAVEGKQLFAGGTRIYKDSGVWRLEGRFAWRGMAKLCVQATLVGDSPFGDYRVDGAPITFANVIPFTQAT